MHPLKRLYEVQEQWEAAGKDIRIEIAVLPTARAERICILMYYADSREMCASATFYPFELMHHESTTTAEEVLSALYFNLTGRELCEE